MLQYAIWHCHIYNFKKPEHVLSPVLAWWTDWLSADAAVHAHTRMWLERLLSGAGLPAWAALHSVSLSPPQPAMAGPVHGEWYRPSHIGISIHSSFSIAHVNVFLCLCWAFIWSSVCAGYQLRASIYSYGPADSQPSPFALDASIRSAEALSGKQTLSCAFFSLHAVKSEGGGDCCSK